MNEWTVGSNQNPVTYLHNILQQPIPLHEFKHVSPKDIENVAKSLKAKDSHGYDELPTKVIKQSISYIYLRLWPPFVTWCCPQVHSPLD